MQSLAIDVTSNMSKGSKPRPIPNPDKYRENFDRIFGKKKYHAA